MSQSAPPEKKKPSIKRLIGEILEEHPSLAKQAILEGLQAVDPNTTFKFLQLAAHYTDGKPVETLNVQELQPIILRPARPGEIRGPDAEPGEDPEAESA